VLLVSVCVLYAQTGVPSSVAFRTQIRCRGFVDNLVKVRYNTFLEGNKMGTYANAVNAYAMSAARAVVYKTNNPLQSYGQTSLMLNVTTAKFRKDIETKKVKFIAKLQKQRVAELQQELARLTA